MLRVPSMSSNFSPGCEIDSIAVWMPFLSSCSSERCGVHCAMPVEPGVTPAASRSPTYFGGSM